MAQDRQKMGTVLKVLSREELRLESICNWLGLNVCWICCILWHSSSGCMESPHSNTLSPCWSTGACTTDMPWRAVKILEQSMYPYWCCTILPYIYLYLYICISVHFQGQAALTASIQHSLYLDRCGDVLPERCRPGQGRCGHWTSWRSSGTRPEWTAWAPQGPSGSGHGATGWGWTWTLVNLMEETTS